METSGQLRALATLTWRNQPQVHTLNYQIINYGIIMKSISALMYTVCHVDKYKITFKLVISHWTNEILVTDICYADVI